LDWLEEFIQKVPQAVLFVSHDEILIENVSNQIIHLEQTSRKTICRHTITKLPYSEYITQRESSYAHQTQMARKEKEEYQKKHERWQQLFERVNHEQKVVSRQFAGEGRLLKKKMKTLKSQQRRLDKQKEDMTQLPQIEPPIIPKFDMNISIPAKKLVLDLKLNELSVGSRILSRNLELQVTGSEHLCIIGDNGAGKTTLLRIISNELLMKTDVKAFYMPQDYGEILDFDKTPVEYLAQSYEKEELTRCRTYLGSMRYTSDEMEHSNNELSGGQKAKLLFIKAILGVYNVLILDEPTRNFSAISSKRIREQLRLFPGTVISVSHDRIYIQEACDRVVELSENGLIEIYE
jgi:ATPase subunit of ABC transporter with duplicated ATPase domains